MATSSTLNKLLFAASIIVYITALLVYGFWNHAYQKKKILAHIDTKLYNNAISLKYMLPDDFHDRAVNAQAISINEDKYIAKKLTALVKEAGFRYAYTIIKQGNKLVFVASDTMADPENERGTFYFTEYENADEIFFHAFEQKTPTYKTVTDKWGTVRTVMVPEKSPGGIQYLACVDFDIGYVEALLQKNSLKSISTVLFFLLLTIPIIKVYINSYEAFLKNIKDSEKKYRDLFENSMDSLFLIGPEQRYLDCNSTTLNLFNIKSKEKFLTLSPIDLSPGHQTDGVLSSKKAGKMIYKTLNKGSHFFEWRHKRSNGEEFDASVLLTRVQIDGQTLIQGTVRDISEQKKTQAMLIQSEKMLSVGGLAAGMAHEINNPLAGMIQSANVLSNRLSDTTMPANKKAAAAANTTMESIQQFMEDRNLPRLITAINESGIRIASIVKNMLSFARKSDASFSTHDPRALMDAVLDLASTDYDLKKKYDFKSIRIEKKYADDLPMLVCTGSEIQQVLFNVLNNGAHAMFEKRSSSQAYQPEFCLTLSKETESNMLRLEIKDNGPGIDQETCSRIFEPFFTTKQAGVGTGLGLSVSYFIITVNHRGTMEVASEPGKGTNFIIRIPFHREA
jgi:PAS domain S-box-containing protein